MSTPKRRRRGPATPVDMPERPETLIASPSDVWEPLEGASGYLISTDGRVARELKVSVNKNGTRFVRIMCRGKQLVLKF